MEVRPEKSPKAHVLFYVIATEVLFPVRQVIESVVLECQVAIVAITSIVTNIPSLSNYSMDRVKT